MAPKTASFPRHLLLAVGGLTPATVTEALWALVIDRKIPISELRVLTTSGASAKIKERLNEILTDMQQDYPKEFAGLVWSVHPIEIEDIRTSQDNDAVSDWILRFAAEACSSPNTIVHASIAGGRKTMGFYLGSAMQLLGRPDDRLYHVLVDPLYESASGFYYPAPSKSRRAFVEARTGLIPSANATIDLAEIPFVPLRGYLGNQIASNIQVLGFRQLVQRAELILRGEFREVHIHWKSARQPGIVIKYGSAKEAEAPQFSSPTKLQTEMIIYTYLLLRRAILAEQAMPATDPGQLHDSLLALKAWIDLLAKASESSLDSSAHREKHLGGEVEHWLEQCKESGRRRLDAKEAFYVRLKAVPSRIDKEIKKAFSDVPTDDPVRYGIQRKLPGSPGSLAIAVAPKGIIFHPPLPPNLVEAFKKIGRRQTAK